MKLLVEVSDYFYADRVSIKSSKAFFCLVGVKDRVIVICFSELEMLIFSGEQLTFYFFKDVFGVIIAIFYAIVIISRA